MYCIANNTEIKRVFLNNSEFSHPLKIRTFPDSVSNNSPYVAALKGIINFKL
jgi:hypothetical protein